MFRNSYVHKKHLDDDRDCVSSSFYPAFLSLSLPLEGRTVKSLSTSACKRRSPSVFVCLCSCNEKTKHFDNNTRQFSMTVSSCLCLDCRSVDNHQAQNNFFFHFLFHFVFVSCRQHINRLSLFWKKKTKPKNTLSTPCQDQTEQSDGLRVSVLKSYRLYSNRQNIDNNRQWLS